MDEKSRVDLYKIAVEEERFNVLLTWDRAKHFLVFNSILLGASPAILKAAEGVAGECLVALLLALGAFHSFGGARVVRLGHDYYRKARDRVIEHEQGLGLFASPELAKLARATTPGKGEATLRKTGVDVGAPRRVPVIGAMTGNITDRICFLLGVVGVLDIAGCALLIVHAAGKLSWWPR